MQIIDWEDDGEAFGNARGLDSVALDVKVKIAERFGATVLVGQLPADLNEIQEHNRAGAEAYYGERASHLREQKTFAAMTISYDGLTISGEHRDGNGHTRGYRSSYWLPQIAPDTVVFDLRTIPTNDKALAFAVRGPMLNVTLPPGKISTFRREDFDPMMEPVGDAYLREVGGLKGVLGEE